MIENRLEKIDKNDKAQGVRNEICVWAVSRGEGVIRAIIVTTAHFVHHTETYKLVLSIPARLENVSLSSL